MILVPTYNTTHRTPFVVFLVLIMVTICCFGLVGQEAVILRKYFENSDQKSAQKLSFSTSVRKTTNETSPESHRKTSNTSVHVNVNSSISKSPPLRYMPPSAANVKEIGIPMNVSRVQLDVLGIPLSRLSPLNEDTVKDFVFVTGASANHFTESRDAVAGVQKYMPGFKIYYYDLGLSPTQVSQIKSFCQVIYRQFNYDQYPGHVRQLSNYAFKPLIIQEVLRGHRGTVWMDASFRLYNHLRVVYPEILNSGGYLQFWHSPHSNYAVTDPKMYRYIPTDVDKQKHVWSRAAGAVYFLTTDKIYFGIFYWWVLCALDKNCISPPGSKLACHFVDKVFDSVYSGCHRYDMSALNVLASNLFGYDTEKYTSKNTSVVTIIKRRTKIYKIQTCENSN